MDVYGFCPRQLIACLLFNFALSAEGQDPFELARAAQRDLSLGRYAQCISGATAAADRFESLGKLAPEADALTIRGQARYYTTDLQGARTDFEQALRIARDLHDRAQEITRLNNVAGVYYAQGRYGEALQRYQDATGILARAQGEPWFESRRRLTEANTAVLYQRIGQYRRALDLYRGMSTGTGSLPPQERAQVLSNMGTLYRRLGDPVLALENYRAAQALFHVSSLLSGEVGVLNNIGIAQTLDLHQTAQAVRTFSEALQMARTSGGERLVMSSLLYRGEARLRGNDAEGARADFQEAVNIARRLRSDEEVWRADYGLARVADRAGDIPESNRLLRECIGIIERMRSNSGTPTGRSGFLIDRREVYDLLIEHESAPPQPDQETIFQLMEASRARELQDRRHLRSIGLDQLRRRLPPDALLIEYWVGEHSLTALRLSSETVRFSHRRISPDVLKGAPSEQMTALLLGSVPANIRSLLIVPDGEISRVPFEALPLGNKKLLIDRVSVTYLPFGAFFAANHHRRRWLLPWQRTLNAFADNSSLPASGSEVQSIAGILGGASALHSGGDYVNEPAPVLHFATHAFADPDDPDRSYILLSPSHYLFLRDAAALPLQDVALVTVSACDSGIGTISRGEGVQSFNAAFLSAGARATVTSLWRVSDKPAAEFMTRFYASLAEGETATHALRRAKLAFRQSGGSAAQPIYWAAFVLNGDGDLRIPQVVPWTVVAGAPLVLVLLMVILLRRCLGREPA